MKKKLFLGMLTAAAVAFIVSCATSIPIAVNHPPKMDTNGIERLAVLPFKGSGDRQEIAEKLTVIFREKITGTGTFKMVDSAVYQPGTGAVDAIFTGDVTSYTVQDVSHQVKQKTQEGDVTVTIYDRKVSLAFTYRLVRERDGIAIGERSITVTANDSNEDSSRLISGVEMAVNAVSRPLRDFNQELVPWTSTEKLVLDKEKSKDKALKARMKEAEALVKAGSYKAAQEAYAKIYAETNSLAAGYNQAILTQPLDGLEAAISLLVALESATGYSKASVELTRLREFLGENAAVAANLTGTSQQEIAIRKAAEGLIAILPAGSRVSLLNISKSESEKSLTDIVIRDITASLVDRNITVLERENLNLIRAEQEYQASGAVSDDSYVSIGHMLGVETIVTFSITGSGHQRKLTVRSVGVETGEVLYNESTEI
jgi:TolB-like protein